MKKIAAPSGDQTGAWGHRSRSGVRSRPSPLARSMSQSVVSVGSSGLPRALRVQASWLPSGENATPSYQASGAVSTRCAPLARSMATRSVRRLLRSSVRSQPMAMVAPSGATSNVVSSSPCRASGVRSFGPSMRASEAGQLGGEQMPLAWPEVVVPATDREGLEELRLHPCLLPRLLALPVGSEVVAPGVHRRGECDHIRGAGGFHGIYAARRRDEQARLSAVGGKQPERADASSSFSSPVRSGSGRLEVKRSEPSRMKLPALSPGAERVSRRAGRRPDGSTSQRALAIFFPSGAGRATDTTSRFPSGERVSPERRGIAR